MKKDLSISIIFLVLALLSFVSVVAFFPLGIPLGLVFASGFLWFFSNHLAKRKLEFNKNWITIVPAFLGVLVLIGMQTVGQSSLWDPVLSLANIVVVILVIYHLVRVRKQGS